MRHKNPSLSLVLWQLKLLNTLECLIFGKLLKSKCYVTAMRVLKRYQIYVKICIGMNKHEKPMTA